MSIDEVFYRLANGIDAKLEDSSKFKLSNYTKMWWDNLTHHEKAIVLSHIGITKCPDKDTLRFILFKISLFECHIYPAQSGGIVTILS